MHLIFNEKSLSPMPTSELLDLASLILDIVRMRDVYKLDKDYFIERGCKPYLVDLWMPYLLKHITNSSQADKLILVTQSLNQFVSDKDWFLSHVIVQD